MQSFALDEVFALNLADRLTEPRLHCMVASNPLTSGDDDQRHQRSTATALAGRWCLGAVPPIEDATTIFAQLLERFEPELRPV
jgi:hypothetical protein